jgi:hypothetical protein
VIGKGAELFCRGINGVAMAYQERPTLQAD